MKGAVLQERRQVSQGGGWGQLEWKGEKREKVILEK